MSLRVPALSLLLALSACGPPPDPDADAARDIVLVVLDTVRFDHTGLDPQGTSCTPHLDALADRGSVFSRAWSTSPWTVPSHASIFTGGLVFEHGTTSHRPRFASLAPTLAERLAAGGFQTAAFYSNPWLTDELSGVLRGFATQSVSSLDAGDGDQGGRETVESLERWWSRRDTTRPAFVFVNLLEAHAPYDPPAWLREDDAALEAAPAVDSEWILDVQSGRVQPKSEEWQRVRSLYAGDVRAADRHLGRILDVVGPGAQVIVTSDHGENLGEHGFIEHQFRLDETLLAVPLVISAPAHLAPGHFDAPVVLSDLYATVLELAGQPLAQPQRHSLSLLAAAEPESDRPLVAEYAGPPPSLLDHLAARSPGFDRQLRARALATVRIGSWRWTADDQGHGWLHDLASDPGQLHDRAASRPDLAESLAASLAAQLQAPAASSAGEELGPIDEETRERLRSLGYVQ